MARPAMRMTASRKDGELITYKNYRGEEKTGKYAPVGVFFARDDKPGFNFKPEGNHKLDPETFYYNVYVNDDDDREERPAKRAKPQPKKAARDDSDDSDGEISF